MATSHSWTSEHVVWQQDVQASTMAINCTGDYSVLAGRKYIAVVDLDKPSNTIKKVPRQSKWENSAAQWSPQDAHIFALAYNQRAEIYDFHCGEITQTLTLKQHTRAISDIDWSVFDTHLLATASIDTFIHLWDTREHRRPVLSLSAVAGAVQVKWNKVSENILATSHEGDVRLWDPRKTVAPVQYITAHLSKIHGIDWSPISENQLATSGQDCSVKFWDVHNARKPTSILSSNYPVWKARFTPFGDGLVTVVVPQLRRGDNSLILWNVTNLDNPVHTFLGHTDDILEFGWRKAKGDSKDCYLITWSKDQSLRIWTIDYQLQKLCGHHEHVTTDEEDTESSDFIDSQEMTDATSHVSQNSKEPATINYGKSPTLVINHLSVPSPEDGRESTPSPSPAQPHNLQQEFSLVNMNIPNMEIDEMDASKRSCTVTVESGKQKVHIIMTFPNSYPYNTPPKFQFGKKTTIPPAVKDKIMKVLRSMSQHQVKRNRSCIEPCFRRLVSTMESFNFEDNDPTSPESSYRRLDSVPPPYLSPPVYGSFQDASVPFPRTSGARFCGSDILVCFVRPPHLQRINAPTEVTPRSLSALGAYLSAHLLPISGIRQPATPSQFDLIMYSPIAHSPTGDPSVSISSFYFQERTKRLRTRSHNFNGYKKLVAPKPAKPTYSGAVVIYSIEGAIPISKKLAQDYVFDDKDVPSMCNRNASFAAEVGRTDLVRIWNVACLMSDPCLAPSFDPNDGVPFAQTPLGRPTLESIIEHYLKHMDIQTVAMLCCAFGTKVEVNHRSRRTTEAGNNSKLSGKWWLKVCWNLNFHASLQLRLFSQNKPGGSPYHTVVPETQYGQYGGISKRNRSNSWSDPGEEFRIVQLSEYSQDPEKEQHEANIKMLDSKKAFLYDQFKKVYAEILYRWNLYEQRAEVLKYVSTSGADRHIGIDFFVECQKCEKDFKSPYCYDCKKYSFECSICHVTVKGASNFCLACGHGGHATHMMEWFEKYETCPTGCGCDCLEKSNMVFGPA